LGIPCSLLGTRRTLGGRIVKHLAARQGTNVREEGHGRNSQQDNDKEDDFPHLLTSKNTICAIGTHKSPRLVEVHVLLERGVVGRACLALDTVRRGVELGGGVLPATPAAPSTDEVVARCGAAAVLAAHDGIADAGHVGAVAVTRRLGLSAEGAEVACPPVTLGTDMLLAGAAVRLEVDDEGGGAVRARHFGTHLYVEPR